MTKITINSNDLKNVVALTGKVSEDKALNDIMRGVLVHVEDSKATFTAANQQITLITEVACIHEAPIRFVIYQADLLNLMKVTPSNIPLDLMIADTTQHTYLITTKIGKTKIEYLGLNPINFPKLPELGETSEVMLDGDAVMSAVTATDFASTDQLRPTMTAVALHGNGHNGFQVVAASQNGLYISKVFEDDSIGNQLVLLPPAAIKLLPAINAQAGVTLVIPDVPEPSHAILKHEQHTIYARLPEGRFVEYKSVIPEGYTKGVQFNASEMVDEIRRITLSIGASDMAILEFKIKGLKCNISLHDLMVGKKADGDIELVSNTDGDVDVAFTNHMISRHLAPMAGVVTLQHNGTKQGAFTIQDESKDSFQMFMPTLLPHA